MKLRPVLYVQDDVGERLAMAQAFIALGAPNRLATVSNLKEALVYLRGEPPFANRATSPLPALIVLELYLRGQASLPLLTWIWRQPKLDGIPVIVVGAAADLELLTLALNLGAADYKLKPSGVAGQAAFVRELIERWLQPAQGQAVGARQAA